MKKVILLSVVALVSISLLSGCGTTKKEAVGIGDIANTYTAANELNQVMDDPNKVSSDESIDNLYTIMNYTGAESKESVKAVIKQGVEDGKKQSDLNKELILKQEIGAGYMLGYVFGCKAVTGNEKKCNDDMGEKYQEILMSGLSEQFGGTMPAVQ
jgi:maltose-binding protein MalE